MPLIKELTFKSLQVAMDVLSQLSLAPVENGEINPEYECYMEEHKVKEDGIEFDLIALWGVSDVFFLHNKHGDKELIFIDYVHIDEPSTHREIPLQLQQLLKRCMLVGYVPVNLLTAIGKLARKVDYVQFCEECQDLVDYTFDVVEGLEEAL